MIGLHYFLIGDEVLLQIWSLNMKVGVYFSNFRQKEIDSSKSMLYSKSNGFEVSLKGHALNSGPQSSSVHGWEFEKAIGLCRL